MYSDEYARAFISFIDVVSNLADLHPTMMAWSRYIHFEMGWRGVGFGYQWTRSKRRNSIRDDVRRWRFHAVWISAFTSQRPPSFIFCRPVTSLNLGSSFFFFFFFIIISLTQVRCPRLIKSFLNSVFFSICWNYRTISWSILAFELHFVWFQSHQQHSFWFYGLNCCNYYFQLHLGICIICL